MCGTYPEGTLLLSVRRRGGDDAARARTQRVPRYAASPSPLRRDDGPFRRGVRIVLSYNALVCRHASCSALCPSEHRPWRKAGLSIIDDRYKRRLMLLLAAAARRAACLQQARAARLQPASRSRTVADDSHRRAGPLPASTTRRQPPPTRRSASASSACATTATRSADATQPAELAEDWARTIFDDRTQPLTVDVGCALGGWCVESASSDASRNFLDSVRPEAMARAQESAETLPELRLPPVQREC